MKARVIVREHATLTTASVTQTLDQATVSASAFAWLCNESARLRTAGAELVQLCDRQALRLDNYVGVIETPCGTQIEILPKYVDEQEPVSKVRRVLRRMLVCGLDIKPRETAVADIDAFQGPLNEWVINRFLELLDQLIKRGIRFDYQRFDGEQRFLKGQLDVSRQVRQPPGRRHLFRIRHDVFEPDRPENRLLHSALDHVRRRTQDAANWRLAHELASYLAPVPLSADFKRDFQAWRTDRLMAHYQTIKPWCSLILDEQVPMSVAGCWRGPSLLFPMERVYERYVAHCLRTSLLPGARLIATASSEYLCRHRGAHWFQLQPDILLQHASQRWVLDAKWKRLDSALTNTRDKYGLDQDDFYQMFAYGHQYLGGRGDLFLIYPRTADFQTGLEPFHFSETLRLWALPFDLEKGELAGDIRQLPLRVRNLAATIERPAA